MKKSEPNYDATEYKCKLQNVLYLQYLQQYFELELVQKWDALKSQPNFLLPYNYHDNGEGIGHWKIFYLIQA
jgi:hypothetical protein